MRRFPMKKREEVRLEIHPDPNRLDECWVGQSKLRLAYGFDRADARRELAQAKAELEVEEAELEMAIRSRPDRFGLEKLTEATVKATVVNQEEYQAAKAKVIEAQHEVDVLDAALDAIDDRKHALQDLVKLLLSDYYGDPKAPAEAKEKMDLVEKQSVRMRGRRSNSDDG
jgi:hypothetical protein